MFKISEARKMFNIAPQTKKALTVWEMANILSVPMSVKQASQGIAWSLATGRLNGGAEMAIRRMTSYQQLQLLVKVVNATSTQAEVPAFLNTTLGV